MIAWWTRRGGVPPRSGSEAAPGPDEPATARRRGVRPDRGHRPRHRRLHDVPVIEVHVAAGDTVAAEDPLLTLESDKATMDVPAPRRHRHAVGQSATPSRGTRSPTCRPARTGPGAHRRRRRRPRRPARRRARRGAGARRRPGRLHRRVPGRRPRQAGRPGRRPGHPGRGVPERGLHPVQGAAARREGDRRDQGDGRARAVLRRAHRSTWTRCAAGRTAWSPGSPAGWPGWPGSARYTVVGTGRFASPNQVEVTAADGAAKHGQLRPGHHRRRLRAGARCRSSRTTTRG